MNKYKKMAIVASLTLIEDMLNENSYFCIVNVRKLADLLKIDRKALNESGLPDIHCYRWDKLPEDARASVAETLNELFAEVLKETGMFLSPLDTGYVKLEKLGDVS